MSPSFHPRVFLSPDSVLGFGLGDWLEVFAVALLLALFLTNLKIQSRARAFAGRTGWSMLVLGILPIALRLALLPRSPAPVPTGADDFGYILLADTLRHFRLANPPHALPAFFEQIFIVQRPTYSSMYPMGQGIVLAAGWMLFGSPWAGVLLSTGAFCALCYWMLRGWTTPGWAFLGGLLAVMEFGPLCYWMNCYWGGAVSASAGCLALGSLPRLTATGRLRYGAALGLGLALQLLTRPFEFLLLFVTVLVFLGAPMLRSRSLLKPLGVACLITACVAGLVLAQNKAVTNSWTTLPYSLYRYQYGIPATFTFQANPIPHQRLNDEQELDYRAETAIHDEAGNTLGAYLERLLFRLRFYRFFFFAPLYLALAAFVLKIRKWRVIWIGLTVATFALGTNFYPYFYPHYIAAIACVFVLASVMGLERLNQIRIKGLEIGTTVASVCVVQFLFWYGVHAFSRGDLYSALTRFESWDYINSGDPQGRIFVNHELARPPGKQLVFVRYGPAHGFHEWVHNGADIDSGRTVWVHDLGSDENEKLLRYYPARTAWLLEPDENPPKLAPYKPDTGPFVEVQ